MSVMVLAAAVSTDAAADIEVRAQVDASGNIYLGEPFTYNVVIDGRSAAGEVDLSPLAGFDPKSAGNRDVSQTSVSIVNGRTTRNIVERYVMSYTLTPHKAGPVTLPPVEVVIGAKTYRTNPVAVNVLEPGATDNIALEMALSAAGCYVGQPVLMTLKFYYSVDIQNPAFNVPVFSDDRFVLENPESLDAPAEEIDIGVGTNVLVGKGRVVRDGRQFGVFTIQKLLIPTRPGRIPVEPASVSVDVAVGRGRGGFFGPRYEYRRFAAESDPADLSVRPLPEEGRPADFYGLVGRYTISAAADPVSFSVGDPVTLTISVSGDYLKSVEWPALEDIGGMAANFRIPSQKSSPVVRDGSKVFTQTIRATNNTVAHIPSIGLSFFDPAAGRYETARTDPIAIEVEAARVLTGADTEGRDFETAAAREVEAVKKGLSANYEGLDALEDRQFYPAAALVSPGYAAMWAGSLGLVLASILARCFLRTTAEKEAAKRRRRACRRALAELKKAESADPKNRGEMVSDAMKRYIGRRFDRVAGSLTALDCRDVIRGATGDASLAGRYAAAMEACEAARYTAAAGSADASAPAGTAAMIREIDRKAGK